MKKIPENLIGANEIASRFGISYQSVNYYTNIGLFSIISNSGNRRLYDVDEIDRVIKRIRELRNKGYPLRLIRNELSKG